MNIKILGAWAIAGVLFHIAFNNFSLFMEAVGLALVGIIIWLFAMAMGSTIKDLHKEGPRSWGGVLIVIGICLLMILTGSLMKANP